MKKSVAIIGKAATAALAPFDDPEWDIWCLAWHFRTDNERAVADLLFDVHSPSFKDNESHRHHFNSHRNPAYFEYVNGSGLPVLCVKKAIGEGPLKFHNGQEYPLHDVQAMLGRTYLECTVSYMMAYAILQGYERIGLYGCHFKVREEFTIQLPSVTYLIGFAEGRGIEVEIPPGAPLLVSGYVKGRYGITREQRFTG